MSRPGSRRYVSRQSACGSVGELGQADRDRLPASGFGLPERRAYPMPDSSHAANAKARAAAQLEAGKLTRADHDRIVRKANTILKRCEDT